MIATKHLKANAAKIKSVEFKCHAPEAQQVFLAGTFNEWKPDATPLVRDQAGERLMKVSYSDRVSRLDPFSVGGVPHNPPGGIPDGEAASAGVIRVLAPVEIALKPISQTRCQPDSRQRTTTKQRNTTTKELLC